MGRIDAKTAQLSVFYKAAPSHVVGEQKPFSGSNSFQTNVPCTIELPFITREAARWVYFMFGGPSPLHEADSGSPGPGILGLSLLPVSGPGEGGRATPPGPLVPSRNGAAPESPLYTAEGDGIYQLVLGIRVTRRTSARNFSYRVGVHVEIKNDYGYLSAAGRDQGPGNEVAALGVASTRRDLEIGHQVAFEITFFTLVTQGLLSSLVTDYPLLIFYGTMCFIYLVYGVGWLVVSFMRWRELLRVQYWIGAVILLGKFLSGVGGGAGAVLAVGCTFLLPVGRRRKRN